LTGRVIAASGEVVRKLHNVKDAQVGRDAFAKVRSENYAMSRMHKLGVMLLLR
jgi:hypothetical protein